MIDYTLLTQRLAQPDLVDLPDWQAAELLNQPDNTLPVIIEWHKTEVGIGTILDVLGLVDGANLLNSIEASTDPVLKWGLRIIQSGKFDLSKSNSRAQLEALAAANVITTAQKDALFALSKHERYPSWAEANNFVVNAREVGLARGGI